LKTNLLIIFLLIIFIPFAMLSGFSIKVWQAERSMAKQRELLLVQQQLEEIDQRIQTILKNYEKIILTQAWVNLEPWFLREKIRKDQVIQQLLILDNQGQRLFPPKNSSLSQTEKQFIKRSYILRQNMGKKSHNEKLSSIEEIKRTNKGWKAGYWEAGIYLIYWWQDQNGHRYGVEINRFKLLSDIVALLPNTNKDASNLFQITLNDSKEAVVYQWGNFQSQGIPAFNQINLTYPLTAWSLTYYQENKTTDSFWVFSPFIIAFILALLVLIALIIYFYRENTRTLREAAQRVAFVNQVSHELKTPLTNIRLYAELLEADIDETDPKLIKKLNIIISESQRLTRMINNVLSFARQARKKLRCQKNQQIADEIIQAVIEQFSLSFATKQITITTQLNALQPCFLDRDILEQVLGNLLSNVEKYAANGKWVAIESNLIEHQLIIKVIDAGAGIAPKLQKNIFKPFVRGNNRLTEGVTGTGIGLSITQSLMQLHGGTLCLLETKKGACFQATFDIRE